MIAQTEAIIAVLSKLADEMKTRRDSAQAKAKHYREFDYGEGFVAEEMAKVHTWERAAALLEAEISDRRARLG